MDFKVVFGLMIIAAMGFTSCKMEKKSSVVGSAQVSKTIGPPNIIYILADDLGYGDLSVYGQKKFQTPHIDKLAAQGMLFTQHYSGSTVCAPSRSALMTGMHTGHTVVRGNYGIKPEGQFPIPDSTLTIAEVLKKAGYSTGAFGKWGLGYPGSEGDPNNQGFDTFYGYNCQTIGHNYYPYHLWSNQDSIVLPQNSGTKKGIYAPSLIHEKTLQFIEENKDRPFFAYVPSIIPHAELVAPEEVLNRFRGKYWPEKVYKGIDEGPKYKIGGYGSQTESHAAFAAMVSILDEQVGEIVQKVNDLGIADNTIIIFTSDNGPHLEGGADPDYFDSNGMLKGYKRDLYEGGIRVPMMVKWPNKIKPGTVTGHVSAFWDVFPTLAEIAGVKETPGLDGISLLPTLLGNSTEQKEHKYLYWEFHEKGGRQAVRMGDWKAVKYNVLQNPDARIELYDLSQDTGEANNVASDFPEVVAEMESILERARTPSEVFRFGKSK
ncbi:Arylsulfatase A [Arenibacter palladensis]|uniref:Arylsulfatase A n=1 Tax=Arenibacter palladensis TaxID=237373 RepID=A0A1M5HHV8_9FLAO|nr:arylsulfatase [Arenibacter palladensis]SHG15554.1 Arylsulfatase A [Arenibacter palladensis]